MSVGTTLAAFVGDRQHKTIALEWGEKWALRGGKSYAASHLTSSVSRLMNDDPVGVRFFFQTAESRELLFDVLGVPSERRRPIRDLADQLVVPIGQQPAKLLVDITPWHGTRDELDKVFRAIEPEDSIFPARHRRSPPRFAADVQRMGRGARLGSRR